MEKSKRLHGGNTSSRPPYWTIFKQASPQLFNIFFVFFVTLALFPAVHSDIAISDKEHFPISEKLYVSILCFLTFNLCAMLGSLASSWVQWVSNIFFVLFGMMWEVTVSQISFLVFIFDYVQPKRQYLVWPVLLRVAFVPIFLFCNYTPKNITRAWPIYIRNDWIYWASGIGMGFTSGYFR